MGGQLLDLRVEWEGQLLDLGAEYKGQLLDLRAECRGQLSIDIVSKQRAILIMFLPIFGSAASVTMRNDSVPKKMEVKEGSRMKDGSVPNQTDGTVEEYEDGQLLCKFLFSKV